MPKTKKAILWGVVFTVSGVLIALLMVIGVLKTSFLLSFIAYGVFLVGFTLGMFGAYTQMWLERSRREHEESLENQWSEDDERS